jgi:hypothetical protein
MKLSETEVQTVKDLVAFFHKADTNTLKRKEDCFTLVNPVRELEKRLDSPEAEAETEGYKAIALSLQSRIRDIHTAICGEANLSPREHHEAIMAKVREWKDDGRTEVDPLTVIPHIFRDSPVPKLDGFEALGFALAIDKVEQSFAQATVNIHRVHLRFYVVNADIVKETCETFLFADGHFAKWTRVKCFQEKREQTENMVLRLILLGQVSKLGAEPKQD